MRAQRWLSGRCFHGGIAPRPLLIFQNSSPSVSAAIFDDVQSAGLGGGSAAAAGPSPLPPLPWQVAQFCSASFLPSATSFGSSFFVGFLVFFASAGAFYSPCAQTPDATSVARAAAATATVNGLRIQDAPLVVEDDAPVVVEGHTGQRHAAIADGAEDESHRQVLELARRLRLQRARGRRVESVAHQPHAADRARAIVSQLDG